MNTTFLDEKFVRLEYDSVNNLIIQTWIGFISSENFKRAIDSTISFSERNPVKGIISDTSQLSIVRREDTEYAASIMPRLIKNGLKKMAFVLSENAFAQMSVKNFENQTKNKMEENELVKNFVNLDKAKAWVTA